MQGNEIAILILSCDKYADLWQGSVDSLLRSWPECPYKIYFVTNEIGFEDERVINIKTGKDYSWSVSFKKALEEVKESTILVWLEDVFVTGPPDIDLFNQAVKEIITGELQHVHMRPVPSPDIIPNINCSIGYYENGRPYAVNLIGFWDKKTLVDLLLPGESPWNFEVFGSYRLQYLGKSGCLTRALWPYVHLVERGKWLSTARANVRRYKLHVDIAAREQLSGFPSVLSVLKILVFEGVMRIGWKNRMAVVSFFRRLFGTY